MVLPLCLHVVPLHARNNACPLFLGQKLFYMQNPFLPKNVLLYNIFTSLYVLIVASFLPNTIFMTEENKDHLFTYNYRDYENFADT
jgi:hypothetical protein